MKLATFNINNINRSLPNLLAWLKAARPDVVCLQELKFTDAEFPAAALRKAGYHAVWRGHKTWNGVAILARKAERPVTIRTDSFPRPMPRTIRRSYIEAAVDGIVVSYLYLPNGNPQPGQRNSITSSPGSSGFQLHARALLKSGAPVVLAGDYANVAPTEIDIYPTKSWDNDALIQPEKAGLLMRDWSSRAGPTRAAPAAPQRTHLHFLALHAASLLGA